MLTRLGERYASTPGHIAINEIYIPFGETEINAQRVAEEKVLSCKPDGWAIINTQEEEPTKNSVYTFRVKVGSTSTRFDYVYVFFMKEEKNVNQTLPE